MARSPRQLIKFFLIGLVALCIIGYGLYQARNIIRGPQVTITSPKNGQTVDEPLIQISGVAKNVSSLSLNDRPILMTEQGDFSEKLLLFSGYNILKVTATDRFGRTTEQRLELILGETSQ